MSHNGVEKIIIFIIIITISFGNVCCVYFGKKFAAHTSETIEIFMEIVCLFVCLNSRLIVLPKRNLKKNLYVRRL